MYWTVLPSVLLPLILAVSPPLVTAALFPTNTQVKMLDALGFRKSMKQNSTSVVAFVAPWCGHCQRMAPEYSKAAEALSPMVPLYAVDCDQDANKRLCSEQGVQGFPTVKLYPRGGKSQPISFDSGSRTANNFFYWASRNIPHGVKRLEKVADIADWSNKNVAKPRALLLTSNKDIPLMWKALGNKYKDSITFAILYDKSGKGAVKLGAEETADKGSKVLIYPAGSPHFARFEGSQKYKPLDKYLKDVVDGTAVFPEDQSKDGTRSMSVPSTPEGQEVLRAAGASARDEATESSPVSPNSPVPNSDTEPSDKLESPTASPEDSTIVSLNDIDGIYEAKLVSASAEKAGGESGKRSEEGNHAKDEL
ncbi:thioredoxin-like protein [Laetiporus sulphureus 93-53]|uniref:Thioredoxin-like protein n=1 Tax=Laetiporus sulphureus 93-53 TaxID=1314785 RepID=A0A165EM31_9APHY|nr:thioredoxin-like protein [Laetiporus sulphureus 93-53]KZT07343.1 thioredoxin-like protein [Laetiporus sulphureus 93-53]